VLLPPIVSLVNNIVIYKGPPPGHPSLTPGQAAKNAEARKRARETEKVRAA
jgi:hypothetical protein